MRIRFYNLLTNTFSDYYTISFNDTISNYQYLVENVTLDTMDEAHQITVEIINEGNTSIYVDNLVLLEDVYKIHMNIMNMVKRRRLQVIIKQFI